jgi:serine/threonine-protein kinase
MLEVGERIEKYEVLEVLGEGGMATVYKVRHEHLGSLHALKVLRSELVERRDIRDRFLDEGRIQAQMRHPNIVPVTDIVAAPGIAGLVAQFVDGPSLAAYIENATERPSLDDVKDIFLGILAGLGYAHEQGVVHRDIKPGNILLARRRSSGSSEALVTLYTPMILDFGIAKVRGALDGTEDRKRTRAGARMGTLEYMSPEQIHGEEDLDQRADIFALSATLYEFVAGRVPFASSSEYDTMRKIVEGETEPPRVLAPGLHPELEDLILKGLSTDREERFGSCAEMAESLKSIGVDGPSVSDRPPATSNPVPIAPPEQDAIVAAPASAEDPTDSLPDLQPLIAPAPTAVVAEIDESKTVHPPPGVPGIVAALLNFFCLPGLGQMCLGQGAKGVAIFFGTIVIGLCSGGASVFFTQVLIAADAYAVGEKLKNGTSVGAWEWF